jgi:hypothetical protein
MKKIIISILYMILIISAINGQQLPHISSTPYPTRDIRHITPDELLNRLNSYNTIGDPYSVDPMFATPKYKIPDTTYSKIANRIVALLNRNWPDSVIKYKVDEAFNAKFKRMFNFEIMNKSLLDTIRYRAMYMQMYFDSVYHYVYDSMATAFKKNIERHIREIMVPDEIVITASMLRVKEAIAIIKADLEASRHFIKPDVAELALAGFGDTQLQQKYFKKHKHYLTNQQEKERDDFIALAYVIQTQESIALLADWENPSTFRYYQLSTTGIDSTRKIYQGGFLMASILGFIKNKDLKEGYIELSKKYGEWGKPTNDPVYYDDQCLSSQQILFVRDWLMANKGKYIYD